MHRLKRFLARPVACYHNDRDRLDLSPTSRLSRYLRFGMLAARQAIVTARSLLSDPEAKPGAEAWLNELIWREFYQAILYYFPLVVQRRVLSAHHHLIWQNDEASFYAWCEGRTGYPAVDATMRQLRHTGWMPNRARMIAASFLLINWRWGERWFSGQHGNWQWIAGTGTDAVPYFRIFNPIIQGRKFDPQGDYIRRWVPELAHSPTTHIHTPWTCGKTMSGYPSPIVDHATARKRALTLFRYTRPWGRGS